jgi:alkylresorcinol/alkylpyrone synthase
VPGQPIAQTNVKEAARRIFSPSVKSLERLLSVFETAAIEQRHFAAELDWYGQYRPFTERNTLYQKTAVTIGQEAIERCLAKANLTPNDIDHFIFVSTSGLATPSIDAVLKNRLSFPDEIKRTPIWGLGCAGGAVGLSRAFEYAKAFPNSHTLMLALELCSLTFKHNDHSKSNVVATALFADGAAAVIVSGIKRQKTPKMIDNLSVTFNDSLDVMGWEFADDGWKVIFSKDIPTLVKQRVKPVLEKLLKRNDLTKTQISHFIIHPGGSKVIDAFEEILDLAPNSLIHTRNVLRRYGNMSSPTVLFVLEEQLKQPTNEGEYGILCALGPGFSCEMILLQW